MRELKEKNMDYKYAVFIGRFQPFHKAHLEVVKHGLKIAEKVIIIVGSANSSPTVKNPWSFDQRLEMIESCFSVEEQVRIAIEPVRDYYYNDHYWVTDIQNKTSQYIQPGDSVALLGNFKDSSSYYLKYFPQWDFTPVKTENKVNATDLRNLMFAEQAQISYLRHVPPKVGVWLQKHYLHEEWGKQTGFAERCKEFKYLQDYKKLWEDAPFPPTFITADSVVICSGHVLVVRRACNPGKDLLALPGGFVKQSERVKDAALRELKEETGIRVDKIILESNIRDSNVFDHPDRSLRGRTITHAYCIKLKDGDLPEVKGNDDAAKAFWLPLMDVGRLESEFFEDHAHIIQYFVNKG